LWPAASLTGAKASALIRFTRKGAEGCPCRRDLPLLEDGHDIRTARESLRKAGVESTKVYTHVLSRGGRPGGGGVATPPPPGRPRGEDSPQRQGAAAVRAGAPPLPRWAASLRRVFGGSAD
jgi:hypothetical protein